MGVQIKQAADGSMGLEGVDGGDGGFDAIQMQYNASTLISGSIFTASRAYVLKSITGRPDVAGTGGACTVALTKAASTVAGGSGVALHTGSYNVAGTANTVQTLVMSTVAGAVRLAAGDSVYVALTGTPTSAVGNLTLTLSPA